MASWVTRNCLAAICLAACLVAAPATVMAKTPQALHDRIKTIYDAEPPPNARTYLDQVKPIWDAAMAEPQLDSEDLARISLIYALALYNSGDYEGAKAVIKHALDVATADGGDNHPFMTNLLNNYAIYQTHSGDPEAGLETQKRALALAQKTSGDNSPEAGAIYGAMASSSSLLGRQRDTLTYYKMSLVRMDPDKDSTSAYVANLGNYANNLRIAGQYDEALIYSRMNIAAALKYLPQGHRALGYAYNNAAEIMMALGRYGEAEALFRQAQTFSQTYRGKTSFDTGVFTYNLARSIDAQGRDDDAEALMLEALPILEKTTNGSAPDVPGMVWMSLGGLSAGRGNLDEAIVRERKALELLAPLGDRGNSTGAKTRVNLAQYLMLKGQLDEALDQATQAVTYYRREFPMASNFRIHAEMVYAQVLSQMGRSDEALATGQTVVDAMIAQLDAGAARGGQVGVTRVYQGSFVRYTDIALAAGRPDLALQGAQWAAHTEISATSQALAARAAAADPHAAELTRRLQDAQTTRLRLDRERNFAQGKSDTEVKRLDGEIAAVENDLKDIGAQLQSTFPDYERLSQPAPQGVDAIRAALTRGHAVLMPMMSDGRLITLVVTRDGLTWDSAPLSRLTAERDVIAMRRTIDATLTGGNRPFDRAAAWELGRAIFTPKIRAALKHTREIEVLGSGPLMSLPFSLLLTEAPQGADTDPSALRDSAWLVKSYAVSVKPALVASPRVATGDQAFLGVGAPVLGPPADGFAAFDSGAVYRGSPDGNTLADVEALRRLPSLPHAADELSRMNSALALPGSQLITGNDATETRIKATDLSHYGVIAFATHGLIGGNLQTLREPALVLTPPAEPTAGDDGLLTASDVAGLHLKARWVILSACNTGSGREAGAAGYSGLARAFMQAGSESLLVSLWPVRDDVADRLSVDTVSRNAKGASQAQALRQAILALMRDSSVPGSADPAIWAPFSLVVR